MAASEEILGVIRYVNGGTSLWDEMQYIIYLTNARVIFVKTADVGKSILQGTEGVSYFKDEMIAEKLSHKSPESILSSSRSNFVINYDDFVTLDITKGSLRTVIDFYWGGRNYKFKIPNNQYHLVNRWDEIYRRFKKLQTCPDCGSELKGPFKYCKRCDRNFEVFTSDLRAIYIKERALGITKEYKQTGIIFILTGFIMIFLIIAVLYPILGNALLLLGVICFPVPILFIIIGMLLYHGRRSGKLLFGVICLIFGATCLITGGANFIGFIGNEERGRYVMLMGIIIFSYGYYLVRNTLRKKTSHHS